MLGTVLTLPILVCRKTVRQKCVSFFHFSQGRIPLLIAIKLAVMQLSVFSRR